MRDPLGSTHRSYSTIDDAAWKKRLNAASVAEARYLWLLLVLGLFYWLIQPSEATTEGPSSLTVPVLDLPIPAAAVLASAPVVLFLVILIVFGTLRAYKTAEGVLSPPAGDETTDEHPNVIDWVAYTTTSSPNWIKGLLGFSYVLYVSVFAFEAWYFLIPLPFDPDPVPGRWFFVATGSVEAVIVFVFITQFWIDRYRRWPKPSAA